MKQKLPILWKKIKNGIKGAKRKHDIKGTYQDSFTTSGPFEYKIN